MRAFLLLGAAAVLAGSPAVADEVRISPEIGAFSVEIANQTLTIARSQDAGSRLAGELAEASPACPPNCIHAMSAGEGVETVGELELLDFLAGPVAEGKGLLIDTRTPAWFEKGTIPGAVNIPFSTLEPSNTYREEIVEALGATRTAEGAWAFDEALELLLFCNGPWCDQSPRAIGNLLSLGYPAEKLRYYRGGVQVWTMLGLTVTEPSAS